MIPPSKEAILIQRIGVLEGALALVQKNNSVLLKNLSSTEELRDKFLRALAAVVAKFGGQIEIDAQLLALPKGYGVNFRPGAAEHLLAIVLELPDDAKVAEVPLTWWQRFLERMGVPQPRRLQYVTPPAPPPVEEPAGRVPEEEPSNLVKLK